MKSRPLVRLDRLLPGLAALTNYRRSWLAGDLAAGLSVAAVALPVGIAYSDLAGVPPVVGIYSAIFPLFAYALFGSSRQLMTGPDAATCIMAAASLGPLAGGDPERYMALMVVMTLFTGVIYVVAGIAKLGFLANFLSLPILNGFLNGIAAIIIAGQLSKLAGYSSQAEGFVPKLLEVVRQVDQFHAATLVTGLGLLAALLVLRRLLPRLPSALIVVVIGVILVRALGLEGRGVAVLGPVPAGLPDIFSMPLLSLGEYQLILRDAGGLALVSFTSGILTAKSFAQRNGYEVQANQELIGFGACNLASALAHGFPVTGADSRTAINNAMGGHSQLVGIVAGGAMLAILLFLTEPLSEVPSTALAAVIIVSAAGLFDFKALRELFAMSHVEFLFSVGTTLGVLLLGVLPGVLLAIVLSLLKLLAMGSKPHDSILGRVPGMKGFHELDEYPDARTIPGLVLYRFDSNLVFFNADYFKQRVLHAIEATQDPVQWVVIDASPINTIDTTAVKRVDELRQKLASRGITLVVARQKRVVTKQFESSWVNARHKLEGVYHFDTLKDAIRAFRKRAGAQVPEPLPEHGSEPPSHTVVNEDSV